MASKLEEIEEAALSLSPAERARLVTTLVTSLEEAEDEEVELAWVEEAERRYQEGLADPEAVEPAAAAFARARDALRR